MLGLGYTVGVWTVHIKDDATHYGMSVVMYVAWHWHNQG